MKSETVEAILLITLVIGMFLSIWLAWLYPQATMPILLTHLGMWFWALLYHEAVIISRAGE